MKLQDILIKPRLEIRLHNVKMAGETMFFIGDLVEIKSWEEMVEEFGTITVDGIEFIDCDFYFSPDMKHLCGLQFKIEDPIEDDFIVYGSSLEFPVDNYSKGLVTALKEQSSLHFGEISDGFWKISSDMLKVV